MRFPVVLATLLSAAPASAQDFWAHWGDGRAELNGYRLIQPRYGAKREGMAVLIFVTEDMSDSLRVKADPGKHPPKDVYPVMKLNVNREFRTGIYPYRVMTSVFARVAAGWPVAKVSFSSQEWCGLVHHQLLPKAGEVEGVFHSYFDGEADGTERLSLPADGVFTDALPILLRGWRGEYLKPGASRTVSLLPSLTRSRLQHRPLEWRRATIQRAEAASSVTVPAGRFDVYVWTVTVQDGPAFTLDVEAAPPYRIIRWGSDTGEEASLVGSTRLTYWKLNAPGDEGYRKELGLEP